MSDDNIKPVIEALLLASDKPLTIDQIKNVLDDLPAPQIRQILEELKGSYEESARGIRIIEVAGGFQLTTPSNLAPFVRKLFKERRVDRLSKPALETLAIIAYKQPVTKLEIESFRNVNIDGVMENLLGKNLVRICGRKDAPGRPFVFGTTRQFLEYFGLKSLEELPKLEEFANLSVQKEIALAGEKEKITEGTNGTK
ncbi:MAG: SMC-Scp complex subunit ScpB [Candidatus Omnitrophica bacterium]|nr:SMC-Scp complex subunit ScpB [Candidatus Omnitrophota bacterium]